MTTLRRLRSRKGVRAPQRGGSDANRITKITNYPGYAGGYNGGYTTGYEGPHP